MKKLLLILAALSLFISCKEEVLSETENNNTFATANAVDLNATYNAEITLEDTDHFSFTIPAGEVYRVDLKWLSGDLDLCSGAAIYSNGAWVIVSNPIDSTDEEEDEWFTITNSDTVDQQWIVGVYDYWNTGTGEYTFKISQSSSSSGISFIDDSLFVEPIRAITALEGNTK